MTTVKQDRDFISAVLNERLLESCIDWIASNMEPEDVFSDSQLDAWAAAKGYGFTDE